MYLHSTNWNTSQSATKDIYRHKNSLIQDVNKSLICVAVGQKNQEQLNWKLLLRVTHIYWHHIKQITTSILHGSKMSLSQFRTQGAGSWRSSFDANIKPLWIALGLYLTVIVTLNKII